MKNKSIIDSWDHIEPRNKADEQILTAILVRNRTKHTKAMQKNNSWQRRVTLTAVAVLLLALIGIWGESTGRFRSADIDADLAGGRLVFYKSDNVDEATSLVWDTDWGDDITRDLTAAESRELFDDSAVTGYAIFRSYDNSLVYLEGQLKEMKIIIAASDAFTTDPIVEGNARVSVINGVAVKAGYFITDANSQGIKNIIYFASFAVEDAVIYLELGGTKEHSDLLRSEIGRVIDQLTAHPPVIAALTAQ